MFDFQLSTKNLIRQDSMQLYMRGTMNPKLGGTSVKVEYRLHKDDFRNPEDPEGSPIELWCIHLPQLNCTYVDKTEESAFEAMDQFFEEDFVRHFAQKLVDERERQTDDK